MRNGASQPLATPLTSPLFLFALGLLLLNDFFLKPTFSNAVTGKVSDFSGLFLFPLFFASLLPRVRTPIYMGTACAFFFWKTSWVDPAIALWNSRGPFPIDRTVDPTDLMALAVLPLSYWWGSRPSRKAMHSVVRASIAAMSIFAFMATSYRSHVDFHERYLFSGSQQELVTKLKAEGVGVLDGHDYDGRVEPNSFELVIPADICFDAVYASVVLHDAGGGTEVVLTRMTHHCPENSHDNTRLHEIFKSKVAEPLALRPAV
jgi:hypothetical protein